MRSDTGAQDLMSVLYSIIMQPLHSDRIFTGPRSQVKCCCCENTLVEERENPNSNEVSLWCDRRECPAYAMPQKVSRL